MINPDAGSGAAVDRITPRGEAHHRLLGIQAGRGFAALLVVFYHATKMISLPQYAGHEPLHGFFQFGHAGVDFFFVLSGFIIMYVHYDDVDSRTGSAATSGGASRASTRSTGWRPPSPLPWRSPALPAATTSEQATCSRRCC